MTTYKVTFDPRLGDGGLAKNATIWGGGVLSVGVGRTMTQRLECEIRPSESVTVKVRV
jgi:hypothetical protein